MLEAISAGLLSTGGCCSCNKMTTEPQEERSPGPEISPLQRISQLWRRHVTTAGMVEEASMVNSPTPVLIPPTPLSTNTFSATSEHKSNPLNSAATPVTANHENLLTPASNTTEFLMPNVDLDESLMPRTPAYNEDPWQSLLTEFDPVLRRSVQSLIIMKMLPIATLSSPTGLTTSVILVNVKVSQSNNGRSTFRMMI